MSVITSADVREKEAGETVNVLVDCQDMLDKDASIDETITTINAIQGGTFNAGMTTWTGGAALTISALAVTTVARKYRPSPNSTEEKHVPIGKGLTFRLSGGANGVDYYIRIEIVTSGTQTRVRYLPLQVKAS
jgi:CO/xanthine dehydrogenase Mo-binding subunit